MQVQAAKRVKSCFGILNEIWTISNDGPKERAKRMKMKKVFWKLEHTNNLPKRPSSFGDSTFVSFPCEELSHPTKQSMTNYFSLR